jgi:hypothetical protein
MTNKTTMRTDKLSFAERHLCNSSAFRTGLACVSRINQHQLRTACYSFVFQVLDESIPRSISYTFSQPMIIKHTFDIQILNCNEGIGFGYSMTEFVQEVIPLISNLDVLYCQSKPCLSLISRTFLFLTEPSLQSFKHLFSFDDVSRIIYKLSIRQDSIAFKPYIQSNLFRRRMLNRWSFNFTSECRKPLSCFVLLDSQGLNLAFRDTMQNNRHRANLAEFEPFIRQNLESALRESDTIHSALESRKPFLFAGLVFHSAKKVRECFVNSIRNILGNLRMDRVFAFYQFVVIKLPQSLARFFVSLFGSVKKLVIDCLTSFERINDSNLLFSRRIYPESIHSQFHDNREVVHIFKCFECLRLIHPTTKVVGILSQSL